MRIYSAEEVARSLPYETLVDNLRDAFIGDLRVPVRWIRSLDDGEGSKGTLGMMPCWQVGELVVVKLLTIFPSNARCDLPTIHAQIVAFDGTTGTVLAVIDGTEVTRRRTAATSALAATYLARPDAAKLLVVGTGPQAIHQVLAYTRVRGIRQVMIWGRSQYKAERVVEQLRRESLPVSVHVAEGLEQASRAADIISCVTSAIEPVVEGSWLKAGAFLDLVGSHSANHRECDDDAVCRARVYVDTFDSALAEGGDILIPLRRGIIDRSHIVGDLHGLTRLQVEGRRSADEVTLFKSVGSALEDYAATRMILAVARGSPGLAGSLQPVASKNPRISRKQGAAAGIRRR
jgi:alanine dehydrogenase